MRCHLHCNLILLFALLQLTFTTLQGQDNFGRVAGRVVSENGQPLLGVSIQVDGTEIRTTSDLEGRYLLNFVPLGLQDLNFSKAGYRNSQAKQLNIVAGETYKLDFIMPFAKESDAAAGATGADPNLVELDTFTVMAMVIASSDFGLLAQRSNAVNVTDAIGTDMMSRLSIGDAADALKRLPGLSISNGKYAVVRGLGDRYGNTTLNGVTLPSPDPDRQAVQLDIFPADLLDAITASKTFTPDLPSNTAGGTVNMRTKSFPEELTISFSASVGYDEIATGNDNFLKAPSGSSDWLAMGAHSRKLPEGAFTNIPGNFRTSPEHWARNTTYIAAATPYREAPAPNFGFDVSFGNSYSLFSSHRLGLVFGATYDSSSSFKEGGQANEWLSTNNDLDRGILDNRQYGTYDLGTQEILWGALFGIAYQFSPEHEVSFNAFNVMSGINEGRIWNGFVATSLDSNENPLDPGYDVTNPDLRRIYKSLNYYLERRLTNLQLTGKHAFPDWSDGELNWSLARSRTVQEEPNVSRISASYLVNTDPIIYSTGSGSTNPQRNFRDLVEDRLNFMADYEFEYLSNPDRLGTLKFGYAWEKSERNYEEVLVDYRAARSGSAGGNSYNSLADFDSIYDGTNAPYWVVQTAGVSSTLDATREITGVFAMFDQRFLKQLRLIAGVRYDETKTDLAGFGVYSGVGGRFPRYNPNTPGTDDPVNDPDGDGLAESSASVESWLPSITLLSDLTDNMNIRFVYSKTIALPSMRELSPYYSQFLPGDPVLRGNPNLGISRINNYDIRFETYTEDNGIMALTLFAKEIEGPIEQVILQDSTAGGGEYVTSWDNNDNVANLFGVELEFRRNLAFIHESLEGFSLGTNFTYIHARVDLDPIERAKKFLGYGFKEELVPQSRRLEGQPEWIFNADVSYTFDNWGTTLSVATYWISDRLDTVAGATTYDTYQQGYEQIDFIVSQKLGKNWKLKFSAKNLTAPNRAIFYDREQAKQLYVNNTYETARTYSFSVGYDY